MLFPEVPVLVAKICMSSKSVSQIFKTYFELKILLFLSFVESPLVDMFNYKVLFLTKKASVVKSETRVSRKAVKF